MSLPVWQATHAYVAGTRITPTTPTTPATTWIVSTAGTSAGVEPTWPTTDPWTITDGTVHWALASSFRQAAVAGVYATLGTFKTANPTLLVQVLAARPKSLDAVSKPCAYIAARDESIIHAGGLRTRTLGGLGVVVVDVVPDPGEAEARMDIVVDGLVDAFTAAFHAISGYSILQPVSVTEIDPDPNSGGSYLGNLISLGSTSVNEGRQ